MQINQYKLDFAQFDNYINSINGMHMVIDFSTVLRKSATEVLAHFKEISKSKCCFYVSKNFDKQILHLIDNSETGFCTEKFLSSMKSAWEQYTDLSLHSIDKNISSYEFFKQLSENGQVSCLLTGNETEAWRHILGRNRGNILLVTDVCSYYFMEESFSYLSEQYGSIEAFAYKTIADDGGSGKCETVSEKDTFSFLKKRTVIQYTDIISGNGAEGIVYKTDQPEIAVKVFYNSVSKQKIKKLEYLMAFEEKKENIAWPIEFVYSYKHFYAEPIGFTMPIFSDIRPLEELQFLDKVTNRHRWKIAVNFLTQILYLYIHNIQIGDYNFNNFSITDACEVILMDMDSYIYGIYGTEVYGRQTLPFILDYSKRSGLIQADYILLHCMIFWILSDGVWPYYYDEDIGGTICRITIQEEVEFHNILNGFPSALSNYYKLLFTKGIYKEPFELLFILFDTEEYFL